MINRLGTAALRATRSREAKAGVFCSAADRRRSSGLGGDHWCQIVKN